VAFGWSFPKLMIVLVIAFFLFAVPIMTWITILIDRHRRRKENDS
jgi:hypothetical protein